MSDVVGNTTGLSPTALRALERIYRRRVPLDCIATPELVRSLAEASRESKRQVGALVHRSGSVDIVVVGDATRIMLPDIGRLRAAQGRFRAIRLVHTHLFHEPLTRDDLTDLTRLRLDLVAAIQLSPEGEPRSFTWAYNVPTHTNDEPTYHIEGPVPWGTPQPDFGVLISSLEDEFARKSQAREVTAKDGRAILVHVSEKRSNQLQKATAHLAELENLADTAGVAVVDRIVQLRDTLDPRYVVGRGKLEEIVLRAIELNAETLVFDCNLTPSQVNGIISQTDLRVIDRTQLILDIFAQRAESRDGKLQVELAQLKYALPRLDLRDDALSRLTGGIGGRGPGETKLEIGRRRAKERVSKLEKELHKLEKQRAQRRQNRRRSNVPVVALIGYTNAGKSTLLNTLTEAGVLAENRLFATLDTRARQLVLPDTRQVVLTDTVGFVRDMPRDLFAAFRATFEEAADADLLLEVVDASDPDHGEHRRATAELLEELKQSDCPRIVVFNKVDRLNEEDLATLLSTTEAVCVSATSKLDMPRLLEAICHALDSIVGRLTEEPIAEPIEPDESALCNEENSPAKEAFGTASEG
jgi:GTP-binding protein HflX